jgi:DNA-binding XRE family transcriptional regulator
MTNRIKYYREQSRMSINDLAQVVGLSPDYIRKVEKGDRGLRLETALEICKALKKTPNTIFLP